MMVRDYIALDLDVPADSFGVTIVPEIGGGLDEAARAARDAVSEAGKAQRRAAAQSRDAARNLQRAGLTGRDIAEVLGLSAQRVSQLLKSTGS